MIRDGLPPAPRAARATVRGMRVLLVYHFFEPDDVVSARLFSELGADLVREGCAVTALTSNRLSTNASARLPHEETWRGVRIVRVRRPAWDQGRALQRLANSTYLLGAWATACARLGPFDAVVVGTDPAFAALLFPALRVQMPRARLIHWAFDLYPEAVAADGIRAPRAALLAARTMMRGAYACADALVDIGPQMRERLASYGGRAARATIPPWALADVPEASATAIAGARRALFGDAKVGLLYSGNLGRAHAFEPYLELARRVRAAAGNDVTITFAGRGARYGQLEAALRPDDTNVRLAPFCDEAELAARIASADMHLVSLRPEWSGLVVPSKFFGSLALGKPVLYAGAACSDVARWIDEYDVGLVLDGPARVDAAADLLLAVARGDDAARRALTARGERAARLYAGHFRKDFALARWKDVLRGASPREVPGVSPKPGATSSAQERPAAGRAGAARAQNAPFARAVTTAAPAVPARRGQP